jgi:enoyl-CoA hydratase/carnithine racemase
VLSADDFDADTAERYGWINRSLPDTKLDTYVDRLARRIATFDATAIATAKRLIGDRMALPTEGDLKESFDTILRLASTEVGKQILANLRAKAGGSVAPRELDLPDLYGLPAA